MITRRFVSRSLANGKLIPAIGAKLDFIEAHETEATAGGRQVSTARRSEPLDLLETRLSRVRHHSCSASDDLDATPELARISFQPRRPRGSLDTPEPEPEAPAA